MTRKTLNFHVPKERLPKSKCIRLSDPWTSMELFQYKGHPGAYRVFSAKKDGPKHIRRAFTIDKEGTLYYGGSPDLFTRLEEALLLGFSYSSRRHPVPLYFSQLPKARKRYPMESLFIEIFPDENWRQLEAKLKRQYWLKHGELPPINKN